MRDGFVSAGVALLLSLGCSGGGNAPPSPNGSATGAAATGSATTGTSATGSVGGPTGSDVMSVAGGSSVGMGGSGSGTATGTGAGAAPNGGGVSFVPPDGVPPVGAQDVHLDARLRRLTVDEFDNTVAALLGTTRTFDGILANDVRQQGFTRNQAQLVDPVFGGQLQQVAQELAAEAVSSNFQQLVPCADTPSAECAATFIRDFGALAYRRPLGVEEEASLLSLYELAAEGRPDAASQLASGVQFVIEVMLQSASFVYVHEIGEVATAGELTPLDSWEIAATLSYLITAGPPDAQLRDAAARGALVTAAARREHAERLLATPAAQQQVRNFVKQWLHLDKVAEIDKADERFSTLRGPMLQETDDFIDEVMLRDDGRLSTLLDAGYTVVGPELETFYGVTSGADGRADLSGTSRAGILQQASFLTANSASNHSSPIIRGVEVLRRVACSSPPDPASLDLVVEAPEPDPNATTRELFAQHASDPGCAMCHSLIDGVGFTFEGFGPIGEARSEEAGKPIDTTGELVVGIEVDGPLVDSADLSAKLAQSVEVQRCFARHVYRYGAASADDMREETFLRGLEAEGVFNDEVYSLLASFAASNSFLLRRSAP